MTETWDTAESMLREGIHPKKVASVLGLQDSEVYRRAKKIGCSPKQQTYRKAQDIVDGLRTGRYKTYQEAADFHETTRQGVYYLWKKYGNE